ncbi:MAG: diguanylate cyclase [Gammaproteobacteria bacterium]|nr:diguanylate cyclase [Gammaproteobacteria bacterium]
MNSFYMGVSDYVIKPTIEEELIARIRNLIKRKKTEDKLHLMANYDELTNLPNRALFTDRFEQSRAQCKRTESMLAVCFLDLDDFKAINDNFSHEVGDQLLIQIAERLKQSLREHDTASRQGGDEFALLLYDVGSAQECQHIMARLHKVLSQPYVINDRTFLVSISSGFTLYPFDDAELDTLLRHADHAMYQAKLAGKNRFQLFDSEQNKTHTTQPNNLDEIEHALASNHLQLYFQPKLNMRTGDVFGAEALIRWQPS